MTAPTIEHAPQRTPEDGRLLVRPPTLARRRPVLSFVGALGLVCLVLAGIGRSGVAAPQVRMRLTGSLETDFDPSGAPSGPCTSVYSLVNDGLRPVEVEGVSGATGGEVVRAGSELSSSMGRMTTVAVDLPPLAPFSIPGGSHREVALSYPCPTQGAAVDPVVHVRSADLGLRRTIHVS